MQDSTQQSKVNPFKQKAIYNNFASISNILSDLSITIFVANKKVISFTKDKFSLCNDKGKFGTFLIVRRWQI